MQIHYCGRCGQRIPPEDIEQGRVRVVDESTYHCATCSASAGSPAQRSSRPQGSPPTEKRIVPGFRVPAGSAVSGRRAQGSQQAGRRPPVLAVVGGAVLLMTVTALAFLCVTGSSPEPERPAGVRDEPKWIPPSEIPLPGKTAHAPPQSAPPLPPTVEQGKAPATAPRKTDERAAQDAFEILEKFEGLSPDDRAGRARRAEQFLAQYGDALVASRARILLRELTITNEVVLGFDFSKGNALGWTASSGLAAFTFADGALITRTTKSDAYMDSASLNVDTSRVTHVVFRLRSDKAGRTQIYYATSVSSAYHLNDVTAVHCEGDGKWHEYEVKLSGRKCFSGQLLRFRLDPVNGDACVGAHVGIQWIRLVKRGD